MNTVVDGNPRLQRHRFLGLPVMSPTALLELDPERVVISVRTAEAPIAAFLESQGLGYKTVCLYGDNVASA